MIINSSLPQIVFLKKANFYEKLSLLIDNIFYKNNVVPILNVENQKDALTPIFHAETNTIFLHTSPQHNYYQQITYQFSHEAIHHLINNKLGIVTYNNEYIKSAEILCSAFSLYVIEYLGWEDYLSGNLNNDFGPHEKHHEEIVALYLEMSNSFEDVFDNHLNLALIEEAKSYGVPLENIIST